MRRAHEAVPSGHVLPFFSPLPPTAYSPRLTTRAHITAPSPPLHQCSLLRHTKAVERELHDCAGSRQAKHSPLAGVSQTR